MVGQVKKHISPAFTHSNMPYVLTVQLINGIAMQRVMCIYRALECFDLHAHSPHG